MTGRVTDCARPGCGDPVELADRHIAIERRVEREDGGQVQVLQARTIARFHLGCGLGDAAPGEASAQAARGGGPR